MRDALIAATQWLMSLRGPPIWPFQVIVIGFVLTFVLVRLCCLLFERAVFKRRLSSSASLSALVAAIVCGPVGCAFFVLVAFVDGALKGQYGVFGWPEGASWLSLVYYGSLLVLAGQWILGGPLSLLLGVPLLIYCLVRPARHLWIVKGGIAVLLLTDVIWMSLIPGAFANW